MATAKIYPTMTKAQSHSRAAKTSASQSGRFGPYGGRYVPETLMAALEELEREYAKAKRDRRFQARLQDLLRTYAGRPTPLFLTRRLSEQLGGAKIYLRSEEHTSELQSRQ